LFATSLLAALAAGCGTSGGNRSPDAFVPPVETARSALEASLRAWRGGHPAGPAEASGTRVEVWDSERDPARPLKSFEILGPVDADRARGFAVRLAFDGPPEEEVVRYLVLGQDPLWVFRQEDYERISHWEHKMEEVDEAEDVSPAADAEAPAEPVHHP
jgi:hypothetical protein